jgi:hypothetical protein
LKLTKIILFTLFSIIPISAGQNVNYAYHDIHTLTIPKGSLSTTLSIQLMNDTIDVLNIKESEFGNSNKYDAIGDLMGGEVKFKYGITDKLMVGLEASRQDIDYASNTITNNKQDLFFRYNIFQYPLAFLNSGISVDAGFVRNKLDDFYMRDINTINDMIKRRFPNKNAKLRYADGVNAWTGEPFPRAKGYYTIFNGAPDPQPLNNDPYMSLENTKDESLYYRFLTGFYTNSTIIDFYVGVKQTKIKTLINTTQEIKNRGLAKGYDLEKILDRDEIMYMVGFNQTIEKDKFIYELGIEYDRFARDAGLDYIDFNYIVDADISYKLNNKMILFMGGKIMYRQLNGQIPYLYNEYSDTSYDHKYGFARFGIQYNFN